jgi:CRP-like cAMP-binding protein
MGSVNNLVPSPELRAELERLASIVSKTAGSRVFRRGDEVSGLFLIQSGRVNLALDCESPIYPTRILGSGAVAGLPATVSGNPYSLTATVVEDAELAFVPRCAVVDLLKRNPTLCFQVMDMLSGEIADIRFAFKRSSSNLRAA